MSSTSLSSLNFSTISTKFPLFPHSYTPPISLQNNNKRRELSLVFVASIPYEPTNEEDYLEKYLSGHGVTFQEIGNNSIAKMSLENGSTANLMLPNGLITSYKARMWHGGTMELLQTSVSAGEDDRPIIQGGVSLAFRFGNDDEIPWSPSSWSVHSITGTPQDSVKVELISIHPENKVEVRHIISLQEDGLSSQLIVSNSKISSIQLMGSIISHLTVSTPEATFAYGLEGSNFFRMPMFLSEFSIIPPDSGRSRYGSLRLTDDVGLRAFFPGWGAKDEKSNEIHLESAEEIENEETENYKNLTDQMSGIYTSAPRDFTIIDRGRRNSVSVLRNGFDELYMFSPGSSHEMYGMYSYVCVGQSALLQPIILSPGDVWTGEQHLHNPNL
ncbi:protein NDH-DEPENDENT CYCLIC ELECTRON FLOW 5 [Euphorbia lathyris]|uniref:protein NDH-DEPENDENT CYCLIC ELECTRON FLOW 5 n=1 Tax=Euphorbia lathyris TaxID=212925 RepID=UPI0033138C8F